MNVPVHQCLFCSETFNSATDKDDHVFEHFVQSTCSECNQNLIRIGSNWYTLHSTVTCVKGKHHAERKFEPDENIVPTVDASDLNFDSIGSDLGRNITETTTTAKFEILSAENIEIVDETIQTVKEEEELIVYDDHAMSMDDDESMESDCFDYSQSSQLSNEANAEIEKKENIPINQTDLKVGHKYSLRRHKAASHNLCGVESSKSNLNRSNSCKTSTKTKSSNRRRRKPNPRSVTIQKTIPVIENTNDTKDRRVQCDECPLTFSRNENLLKHKRDKHQEYLIQYECSECNKRYCSKYLINRHYIDIHGHKPSQIALENHIVRVKNSKKGECSKSNVIIN